MAETPPFSGQSRAPCTFDAETLTLKLSVSLAADRDAVDPVVVNIMNLVREMKCAVGREDDIELALTEALANAVVHGAKSDSSKVIECDVACDEKRGILIVVRDPGPGFDPAALPSPTEDQNLFSDHGRGIYLINKLMDEVKHERNGTVIRMRKF